MHQLARCALRTIRRHDLIPRGTRVVAAVSGGSDSVALLLLLRELEAAGEFTCAGVAHVNHRLRAETAARDQAFTVDLAARLGLPVDVSEIDAAAIARQRGTSLENAARIGRYDALRAAMERLDATRVATGHTRDDQAETFLLHAIRGAGPRGRRGIHPRRGALVRPLLDATRDALRAYLAERGVAYCEDETNADVAYTRNRVRHELMPLLRERFSPAIAGVLARNADIAAADEAYLSARAREAFARIVRGETAPDRVVLDAVQLAGEPPALAWRIALAAIDGVAAPGSRSAELRDARALVDAAAGTGPVRLDLPGVRAERIDARLVLQQRAGRGDAAPRNSFRYALSIPGEVWLREAGCAIAAQRGSADEARSIRDASESGEVAVVAASAMPSELTVRSRQAGDAFRPLGLGGRKKLQDFFVDRKVLRERRDRVPLIVDDRDRIIWVAGHVISEEFRVPDGAQAVVILRLKTRAEAVRSPAARLG